MVKQKLKECIGCDVCGRCKFKPYHLDKQGNKIICPCTICLIKGICTRICTDFVQYIKLWEVGVNIND